MQPEYMMMTDCIGDYANERLVLQYIEKNSERVTPAMVMGRFLIHPECEEEIERLIEESS